jgi:hypothetical protein
MRSNTSPLNVFLALSIFLISTNSLPIHNTIDGTSVGPSCIYSEVHTETVLPRDEDTSRPNFESEFGETILPREHNVDNGHTGETRMKTEGVSRLARSVDKYGKTEVRVEAKFDPRAEVADGRGAKKGTWRSAANQFLPSSGF